MAPATKPPRRPGYDTPVPDETFITDLRVEGALPSRLSGHFLRIGPNPIGAFADQGDAMVHTIHLHSGRAVSYRNRWITSDTTARKLGVEPVPGPRHDGSDMAGDNLIRFGSSTFALGDASLAYELTPILDTVRRVDLAGKSRGVGRYPKLDPITGELHVLATGISEAHVVVSPGGLTRTNRPLLDRPGRVTDLAITRRHLVVAAEGFVGLAPRLGDAHITWSPTGISAPRFITGHDHENAVVVYTLTPSLERWTLQRANAVADRTVLDPTPHAFARSNEQLLGEPTRYCWTVADSATHKHDLITGGRETHAFHPGQQPGDFIFVADPTRSSVEDGGWLIGLLHQDAGNEASLVVLDAADVASASGRDHPHPATHPGRAPRPLDPDPLNLTPRSEVPCPMWRQAP